MHRSLSIIWLVLIKVLFVKSETVDYGQLIRTSAMSMEQTEELQDVIPDLDVWFVDNECSDTEDRVCLLTRLTKSQTEAFDRWSASENIQYLIVDANLQQKVQMEQMMILGTAMKRQTTDSPMEQYSLENWFNTYHSFDEIRSWCEHLSQEYSTIMTLIPSIGKSHHYRDIFAMKINRTPPRKNKKQIWIQGLIHAREWIAGSVVQFICHQLLTIPIGKHPHIDDVEFLIVPVVNPDGYVYSWEHNRFWRKNRATTNPVCSVDLNRNFDDHWSPTRSASCASEVYSGTHAASEPETNAIMQFFMNNTNIVGAIDWHSFSQLLLYPFAWTKEPSSTQEKYQRLVHEMQMAMVSNSTSANRDSFYTAKQASGLYTCYGTAMDWFSGVGARTSGQKFAPMSLVIELPPKSMSLQSFIVNPMQILPISNDNWNGFVAFVQFVTENAQFSQ